MVNDVLKASVDCDFAAMYGETFAQLSTTAPKSVIIAEGSAISVDWKRLPF